MSSSRLSRMMKILPISARVVQQYLINWFHRFKLAELSDLKEPKLSESLKLAESLFDYNFDAIYKLSSKGYSKDQIKFSKMLLSNMIGGMGFVSFSFLSVVTHRSDISMETLSLIEPLNRSWRKSSSISLKMNLMVKMIILLMVIMIKSSSRNRIHKKRDRSVCLLQHHLDHSSREASFGSVEAFIVVSLIISRDEGFHQTLLRTWDNDLRYVISNYRKKITNTISLKVLKSWAELVDKNGWVGREQILGEEARSKVSIPDFSL